MSYVIKKYFVFFLVLIAFSSCFSAKKQRSLTKTITLRIEHQGGSNGAGVAWHPEHRQYYAAIAGNSYFPMFVFNADGKRIGDTTNNTMFDVRGIWYNTTTHTLQSNGYKDFGIGEYVLDKDGFPGSVKKTGLVSRQPTEQNAAAFDTASQELYFFDNTKGVIIRQSLNGNADTVLLYLGAKKKKNIKNHRNKDVLNKYNENTCIYTGGQHSEIGLLNVKDRKIELYSVKSGLLKQELLLPADAPAEFSLNFSYANGIYWFFDRRKREWRGYR